MKQAKYAEAAQFVMAPVALSVRPLHPLKVWEDISPQFLVTFWSMSMYDLFVPAESYQREINKLKQHAAQAADSKEMVIKFRLYYLLFCDKSCDMFHCLECEQSKEGTGTLYNADRKTSGREEKAGGARGKSFRLSETREGRLVLVEKRKISEKRNNHAILAAVLVSAMHLHYCRCDVLRKICTHHSFAKDRQLFDASLLRQSELVPSFYNPIIYVIIIFLLLALL